MLTMNRVCKNMLKAALVIVPCSFMGFTAIAQQYATLSEDAMLDRLKPPTSKVSAVIDTDTYNEIDDQFAVVYALLSPEKINVEAIYAAPYLNNRSNSAGDGMEKSYDEILNLLDKMQRPHNGFVFRGSANFLTARDKPVESPAARDLVKKAMASEGPLYVLTVGAPTNVASAILMEPQIINKIVVVWLGGAAPDWRTADEFNLKQDMFASQVLFNSGVPLIQLPTLPVTSHLQTTIPEVEHFLKGRGAIGDYLCEIFREYNKGGSYAWSKVIWDISAIAYVVEPKWFATEIRHSPVLTDQITYSVDRQRHFYRVAFRLDRDRIFGDMFRKIQDFSKTQTKK